MNIPEPDEAMSSARLFELIQAAFPLRPLPEMSLHQAQLADESMSRRISDDEWRRAGELDSGRSWKDFSDDDLIACDAALSHFDEPSFVYYLPAYLVFALRHCAVEWTHPAWSPVARSSSRLHTGRRTRSGGTRNSTQISGRQSLVF